MSRGKVDWSEEGDRKNLAGLRRALYLVLDLPQLAEMPLPLHVLTPNEKTLSYMSTVLQTNHE